MRLSRTYPGRLSVHSVLVSLAVVGVGWCGVEQTWDEGEARRLVAALAAEDAVARFEAEEQLAAMRDVAVAALAPLAASPGDTPARRYAINVLATIGTQEAVSLLCDLLEQDEDTMIRGLICQHLGRLGIEDAVPIIGTWLATIRGRAFDWGDPEYPRSVKPLQAWVEHVHALREIGSEKAIPILESMIEGRHTGTGGTTLMQVYRQTLYELQREAEFWSNVRRMPGLEPHARWLFDFLRGDTLALIRVHRSKVVNGGLEGRWVLEDLAGHPDTTAARAAVALLLHYEELAPSSPETAE